MAGFNNMNYLPLSSKWVRHNQVTWSSFKPNYTEWTSCHGLSGTRLVCYIISSFKFFKNFETKFCSKTVLNQMNQIFPGTGFDPNIHMQFFIPKMTTGDTFDCPFPPCFFWTPPKKKYIYLFWTPSKFFLWPASIRIGREIQCLPYAVFFFRKTTKKTIA